MLGQRDGETSRLLITEPPLLVLPSLAIIVGLNEAIFLQQLHYWLLHSGKERDGRKWVYNTYDEWHAQLPFWSVRTIRRIVGGLEEQNLVLSTTKYNQQKVDQTKWYSLDYHVLDDLTVRADHVDNVATSADRVDNLASWSGHQDPLQVANLDPSVPETTAKITGRDIEDSKIRRAPPSVDKYDDLRLTLLPYAEDLAREMNDQAPLASTTSRLVNLYRSSGLDMDTFLTRFDQARAITKERTASIRGRAEGFGPKPKTQYFMAVLEDLTGRQAS